MNPVESERHRHLFAALRETGHLDDRADVVNKLFPGKLSTRELTALETDQLIAYLESGDDNL